MLYILVEGLALTIKSYELGPKLDIYVYARHVTDISESILHVYLVLNYNPS